ncbi:hypothetical protein Ntsu_54140 [Nocardia sp. IFM 10818]
MSGQDTQVAAVEFRSVTKEFQVGKQTHTALREVDLRIERGEIFGVIGYSGAGKSTLVRLINALEKPTSGAVLISGNPITGVPESRVRQLRRDIGMVFQQFNLFRSRTAAGNIEYPLKVAGWKRAERKARVAELLEFVGLSDKARSYPDQLSGGQKQRVGIARALATSPSLLLADEATSALDPETTQEVLRLLKKVNRELGVTIIVITHEMDVIRAVADRVAVLAEGRIVELATTFDVFAAPQAAPTRSFVETVLHNRPNAEELKLLGEKHSGRLVTVDIDDDRGIGDALLVAAQAGVRVEVVYGGVSSLQDKTFGSITLALDGPDGAVAQVADELTHPGSAVAAEAAGGTRAVDAAALPATGSAPEQGLTADWPETGVAPREAAVEEASAPAAYPALDGRDLHSSESYAREPGAFPAGEVSRSRSAAVEGAELSSSGGAATGEADAAGRVDRGPEIEAAGGRTGTERRSA